MTLTNYKCPLVAGYMGISDDEQYVIRGVLCGLNKCNKVKFNENIGHFFIHSRE